MADSIQLNESEVNDLLGKHFKDCFDRQAAIERSLTGEHAITRDDPLMNACAVLAAQKRPDALKKYGPELPQLAEHAPKASRQWFSFFMRDKAKTAAPEQKLDQQQPKMKK